jgi:phospholipid/cholesterol/gamma-HCH transport system permease protein
MNKVNNEFHADSGLDDNSPFQWDLRENQLILEGNLILSKLDREWKAILEAVNQPGGNQITVILENLNRIDTAGVAFLQLLQKEQKKKGVQVTLKNVPGSIQESIENFSLEPEFEFSQPSRDNWIENVGKRVYRFFTRDVNSFITLTADTMFFAVTDIFNYRYRRKGEFLHQTTLIGTNAIPIIILISFLIGLVLTLQSAAQLRQFGANVYVADLIVISMTREMGPLITAIILAGRSGSAISSEIGTMVVTEEVDALKVMAVNPIRYLVIPKLHAMILVLPILAMMSILLACLGAVVIGYLYLDIAPLVFYSRIENSLLFADILTGLVKSLIFAGLIVITGSYYGFQVKGGGEAVGRNTTASVVTAILLVILADSILGLIFYFDI